MIARQLVAMLLVLLVANPVCCCTIGDLLGKDQGSLAQSACPSCCSGKKAKDQNSSEQPGDDSGCPCGKSNPAFAEAKLSDAGLCAVADFVIPQPTAFTAESLTAKAQPPFPPYFRISPPSPPWRLYCCYLL